MIVKTYSAAVNGLDVTTVTIEVSLARGVMFHLSGLADAAVKESHDRIVAALQNNGYKFPTADITVNKNKVPYDERSAFQTSGIRLGTAAMTTRGAKEDMMHLIAELIEEVLNAPEDEKVIARVREKVNETMKDYPLFAY